MSNEAPGIAAVLRAFDEACVVPPERQPGGFSGAVVWKVTTPSRIGCLRRWQAGAGPADRLRGLHRLLARLWSSGVATVAVPFATCSGDTLPVIEGRFWQFEPWLPGRADFREFPTTARLAAAMHALARWHRAADRFVPLSQEAAWFSRLDAGTSPSVSSRLELVRTWLDGKAARLHARLRAAPDGPLREPGRRLLALFERAAPRVAAELAATSPSVPLQPCLRDLWHDHVLFEQDTVTGLIDPSACRTESVAADLSRLLGSLLDDNRPRWEDALDAYDQVRPLSLGERRLVRILDRSGVLLSGMTWLDRHYLQNAPIVPVGPVVERLNHNLGRLESLVRSSS